MIRTKKMLVCVDESRVSQSLSTRVRRRVRVLDELSMTTIAETSWSHDNEAKHLSRAFSTYYNVNLPIDPNGIIEHLANCDDATVDAVRDRLNQWHEAAKR